MDHVLDRTPHYALGACVGATADGHNTRQGLDVGFDVAIGLAFLMYAQVFGAPFGGFLGVGLEDLLD